MLLRAKPSAGFTLVEVAVVLIILAIILATIALPLRSQISLRNLNTTRQTLQEAKDAIIGFALVNGRLPCTAGNEPNNLTDAVARHGVERYNGDFCSRAYTDFLPGITLGMETNASGYVLDGWGREIRYVPNPLFAKGKDSTTAISDQYKSKDWEDILNVCSVPDDKGATASAVVNGRCGAKGTGGVADRPNLMATRIAFILISTGENGVDDTVLGAITDPYVSNGVNTGSWAFVNLLPGSNFNFNNEAHTYDDVVLWVSGYELFNRMGQSGKLPLQ